MNELKTVTQLWVGASGWGGRPVLALALSDPRIGVVQAPTRKVLAVHPKLIAVVTSSSVTKPDTRPTSVDSFQAPRQKARVFY